MDVRVMCLPSCDKLPSVAIRPIAYARLALHFMSAGRGIRTHTGVSAHQFLRLNCLPFQHPGVYLSNYLMAEAEYEAFELK